MANYCVSMKEFDEAFTGIALIFEPTEEFVPSGKPKSIIEFGKKRLVGLGAALVFAFLTGLIAALMNIINPVFSKVFMDRLLKQTYSEWLVGFLLFFALFNLIQIIMSGTQAIYNLRIDGKLSAVGNHQLKVIH